MAMQAAQMCDAGEELGLLFCDLGLVAAVAGLEEVEERDGLVAGLLGGLECRSQAGIGDEVVDGHIDDAGRVCGEG